MIAPIPSSYDPDLSHTLPPLRLVVVESYYESAEPGEYILTSAFSERSVADRSVGQPVGGNTAGIPEGDSIVIRIRPGTRFAPVMLGWVKVTYDGEYFTYEDEEAELTSDRTYPRDDTSGETYSYRQSFVVWRKPFGA